MNIFLKSLVAFLMIVIPQVARADMKLLDWVLFSDKAYAKHVDVKAYILTEKQSADLLAAPSKEPIQLLASVLAEFPKKYLVLRVKNLGNKNAWGTLACSVPRVWHPIKIPIISIHDDFCNYLISLEGLAVAESHEYFTPKISFEWDQLYTK